MLNDIQPHLHASKGIDLLRRLENKRVEQALPAEMELGLLWGLLQLGGIEVDSAQFGTDRRPDAYSEFLFLGRSAIVEIAALSDASL